jgi:hypothetical protein
MNQFQEIKHDKNKLFSLQISRKRVVFLQSPTSVFYPLNKNEQLVDSSIYEKTIFSFPVRLAMGGGQEIEFHEIETIILLN